MTQPTNPTLSPTSGTATAPDRRGFASAIRQSLITEHPGWATISGVIMTCPPYAVPPSAPVSAVAPQRQAKPATSPASNPTRSANTADAAPRTDLDDILDFVEAEAAEAVGLFSDALPQVPDGKEAPLYTLRPTAALAMARLVATFPSPAALYQALSVPGSLTVLAVNSPGLDETLLKLIEHLCARAPFWPDNAPLPHVVRGEEAVLPKDSRKRDSGLVGQLVPTVRAVLETRRPVVAVAVAAGTLPSPLRALKPSVIPLAPLDRSMLADILTDAYPDIGERNPGDAATLALLPDDAQCKGLGPEDLVLALRSPTLDGAIAALVAATTPAVNEGPGLADFPLPREVREPVEQMVAELRAWRAGEIPWRDVTRGILLSGPPGSGKTEVPRLIAQSAGITVVSGSIADWSAEGSRGSEVIKAMRECFARAATRAPALLFIDELDAVGDRDRVGDNNRSWTEYVVSGLLAAMDGFEGHEGVVLMGATNHVERIDKAVRRPGRFDRVLHLGYPTPDLLPAALRWQAWPDLADVDLTGLAARAVGMSGAQIAAWVRSARGLARRAQRPLSVEHLETTLRDLRPPMPDALRWQVAIHEAGHAVVGAATGVARPKLLALQADGGVTHSKRLMIGQRRSEMEAALALDLAGRAGEIAAFGEPSGGAGGEEGSDLASATLLAVAIEASLGLGDRLVWQGSPQTVLDRLPLDGDLRARVEGHLRRAEARALRIVEAHLPLLEEIAGALCRAALLTGPELDALLARVSPEPAIGTPLVDARIATPQGAADPAREPADNINANPDLSRPFAA
ncbi:AAA family ATPase [Nioella ostreopsis]|uniref:AAA family ATPase n=1 Tax=Nioella ostreopsis TaxID=2448479 RepID=UPI000FDA0094|nr:AAA family ATPase [Nioella ostreopsis]